MFVYACLIIAERQCLLFVIRANIDIRHRKPILNSEIQLLVNSQIGKKIRWHPATPDFYKFPMTI